VSFFASGSAECIVSDVQNSAFVGLGRHSVLGIVDGVVGSSDLQELGSAWLDN